MGLKIQNKRVRFQTQCDYLPGPEELTTETILTVWYQPQEFNWMRADARRTCHDTLSKGLSAFIRRTYGHVDSKTQDMLNMWAKCKDSRRGLERFIDAEYSRSRVFVRRKTIQGVLYTQDRIQKEGGISSIHSPEIIRNVATVLSRDPIKFAEMLGKADQEAVASPRSQKCAKECLTVRLENLQLCQRRCAPVDGSNRLVFGVDNLSSFEEGSRQEDPADCLPTSEYRKGIKLIPYNRPC